ncbi:MAG: hypothetical protein ACOX7R_00405 [Acetivibrionales bacterium]|jgi:hypothetical protein
MVRKDTREVVVIKNINSNIIEEAILILKSSPGKNKDTASADKQETIGKKDKDYILNEAQLIIDNYIKENKLMIKPLRGSGKGVVFMNRRFSINSIINISLGLSIIGLIFILLKLV